MVADDDSEVEVEVEVKEEVQLSCAPSTALLFWESITLT